MSGIKWTKSIIHVCRKQVPVLYKTKPAAPGGREVIELRNKEMSLLGMIERGKDSVDTREAIEVDIHIYLQGCLNTNPKLFG